MPAGAEAGVRPTNQRMCCQKGKRAMSPVSYQGPMETDKKRKPTHSQSAEGNLGVNQPGLTVESILANKGDDIFTVTRHTTIKELVAELTRLRVGALVVVDSSNEPVGIVSERDVIHAANNKGSGVFESLVEDIMTPNPKTCSPNDMIEVVARQMIDEGFRHMPVIEAGKLSGVISVRDCISHRLLEIEYENLKIKQAIVG